MKISIVVPLYNEDKNIDQLYAELTAAMKNLKKSYEIILIDDGSTDSTFSHLQELHKKDKHVKVIKFRANFGQTAAIEEGIKRSQGSIIITMDGDLQNDPQDIEKLLDRLGEGYSVVSGWRRDRKDGIGKRLPSKFQNWLVRKMTNARIHDSGCSLKAYRREVFDNIHLYGEMHRYIPSIIASQGFSVAEIVVNHRPRVMGKTKYGIRRLFKGMLDLLYIKFWADYSTRPLHFFGGLGIIQYGASFLLLVQQIIKAFLIGQLTVGPVLLLAVLLVITGTIFILFGILTEIQIRTYFESSKKSCYSIEKILEH